MGRLFWKILIALWLTLIGVSVAVGFVVSLYNQSRAPAPEELASGPRIALMTNAAANALRFGGPPAFEALLADWPVFTRERLFAVNQSNEDLLQRAVPAGALARARSLASELPTTEAEQVTRRRAAVQTASTPAGQEILVFIAAPDGVASDRRAAAARNRSGTIAGVPLTPLLISGFAALVFAALMAWYLSRPVRTMRRAFERLAQGDLETRVAHEMGRRRDEVADLGRDFDHMAARLSHLVAAQRQLLHDVSHELRSPLARLQAAIGLARQSDIAPHGATAAAFERIERESNRLDALVGELLTLSRLEARADGADDEYFDMLELADAVLEDARFEAENAGIRLNYEQQGCNPDSEALIRGRAELLHRALENIVRNALKYSQPGQTVDVAFEWQASRVRVSVSDEGPGVPPDQLGSIFEPFVRAGSTPVNGGGYGLGLAIAQRAVLAHGGTIEASNRPTGGLCVSISLPLSS
jgi:two-component system OmpR family sensor kinase